MYDMDEDAKPTAVPKTPVMDELAPFDEGEHITPMGEPIIGSPFDKRYYFSPLNSEEEILLQLPSTEVAL